MEKKGPVTSFQPRFRRRRIKFRKCWILQAPTRGGPLFRPSRDNFKSGGVSVCPPRGNPMDKNAKSPLSGRVAGPEVDRMHLPAGKTPHGRIRIRIVIGHFFNEKAVNI